ncbi:hypothetical protein L218DRAFT_967923 [Marasmius fiardii PR-910]|nr:hypothetical protein L218DRAFT_967923 [Marasmius fiardii PR-910]
MKRVDRTIPKSTSLENVNASGSKNVGSVWETRNPFYCAPRNPSQTSSGKKSGTSQGSKKSSSSSSRTRSVRVAGGGSSVGTGSVAGTQTVSSISFAHATERQMELDERIAKFNEKLGIMQKSPAPHVIGGNLPGVGSLSLAKMTHDHQIMNLKGRIEKLARLKESDWALGLTDVLPPGLYEAINQNGPLD